MVTTQNVPDSRTSYFKLNCCRVFWLKTELVITCDRTVRTQPLSWDSHLLKHSLMTLLPGEQYRAAEAPVRPLARPRPAPGGQAAPRPQWGQSSRPRPGWGRQPGPSHQTRQPWLSLSVCRPCQCSLSSAIVFCLTSLHRWSFSLSCLSSVPTSSMLVWLNSSWRPSNLHHIISNCNVTLINWRCCCCLVLLDNFNLFSSLLSCISLVLYPPLSYISCLTSPHYLFPFQEARLITWLDHWLHPKVDSYSNITQWTSLTGEESVFRLATACASPARPAGPCSSPARVMGLHDKGKQTAQNHQHWQSLSLTKLTSPTPLYWTFADYFKFRLRLSWWW